MSWVEQDAEEILANIRWCLEAAGPVDAIAIANQGESCLAWDAVTGEPLSRVISWQDSRTAGWIQQLKNAGGEDTTLSRAGLPLDAYFAASKLAWLLKNNDAVQTAMKKGRLRLGTTDAFFLDRLTGRFSTDVTTASRTSLMNLATCEWDPELCALFDIPIDLLPKIQPTASNFGEINGVPVLTSIVDQQASLYGHGCRDPGDMKITFGTGAFALALTGTAPIDTKGSGALSTVAWQTPAGAMYAIDGGVYDAGAAVDWLRRISLFDSVDDVCSFPNATAIERDLVFVPALSGRGSPHWDRSGAALWLGMTSATTRSDLCQAALEGIALRTVELTNAIDSLMSVRAHISVDGGLSQNAYFVQFLADASGREVWTYDMPELTGFGAAAMALDALTGNVTPPLAPSRKWRPQRDGRSWLSRFANAVARAKGWRGTMG
ncbi:carbohydrate kinase [Kaistia sp. 32K]|nr:carbohydrate kinase [Kaistia sp. 32K]